MIAIGTPQNYLGTLESILKGQNLKSEDIICISNGLKKISYTDFCSYARSKEFTKVVDFDGVIVVAQNWHIQINHMGNIENGQAFTYEVTLVSPEQMSEYSKFLARLSRQGLAENSQISKFFFK